VSVKNKKKRNKNYHTQLKNSSKNCLEKNKEDQDICKE